MNFRALTDDQLHQSTVRTADSERAVTLLLLKHLSEVERRHLYSKFNCASLHAYCVKQLKMSDPQAGRRVGASRLLKEVPAIEEKLLDGSISLTSLSQAAVYFNKEARSGNRFERAEKLEVLIELESKSTRDVDQILISKSLKPEIHFRESVKPMTEAINELKANVDHETLSDIRRLKEIWSHAMPNASYADLIKRMAKECLEKFDPLKKAERSVRRRTSKPAIAMRKRDKLPKAETKSFVRHQVRLRDHDQCTFVDVRTSERCDSKHFLEDDHIVPKAMGGEFTVGNIRLRCRAHNQRHAIDSYGMAKMQSYLVRPS
jgi:hypothetical protein